MIVDVEATPAYRIEETEATKTMVERVEDRFGIKPKHLIGDTAYGTAALLSWMVDEKHIEPHVPVWERYRRTDGSLSSDAFQWDEERDEYRCPQGHIPCAVVVAREGAYPRHQSGHGYLPIPSGRLPPVSDESQMLSEHTDPQGHTQHP